MVLFEDCLVIIKLYYKLSLTAHNIAATISAILRAVCGVK